MIPPEGATWPTSSRPFYIWSPKQKAIIAKANPLLAQDVLDFLAENPVSRVIWFWQVYAKRYGLSPVGLAAVTRRTPLSCILQVAHEGYIFRPGLCVGTALPVMSMDVYGGWSTAPKPPQAADYFRDWSEFWRFYEEDAGSVRTDRVCENGPPEYDDQPVGLPYTVNEFFDYFGGKSWKKWATRKFNLISRSSIIDEDTYRQMRLFYLGRDFRLKKP